MPKCKQCGKNFRAGVCGMNYDWWADYCSESCWANSDEYKNGQEEFAEAAAAIAALSPKQCRIIHKIIDNQDLLNALIDKLCEVMQTEESAA